MELLRAFLLTAALAVAHTDAPAQADLAQLGALYQDLQSSDWATRQKAFKRIRDNEEFLKQPQTGDRLLALLVSERLEMQRRAAAGLDAENELYDEALETAWRLWKDKLTPEAFRVFAEASYNPGSRFARELGLRAGRFVKELIPLTTVDGEEVRMYTRENATALVGYALAADQQGIAPLSPPDRAALIQALTRAASDRAYGVRWAAVSSMKLAGGQWAIPVLEQMRTREPSLHPTGMDPASKQYFEAEIEAAIQAIRARSENR